MRREKETWLMAGIVVVIGYVLLGMEEQYEKTLLLPYLFMHTIFQLVLEYLLLILVCIFIYVFIKNLVGNESKNKLFKIFRVGYIILCFVIVAAQPIRMNLCYELNNSGLTTAHILCYQVLDMVGNDTVTFTEEPCRLECDMVSYHTLMRQGIIKGRRSISIKKHTESYYYLCLDNQRDMIPIPSEYIREIEESLEENEGVCDITCYKFTHLIKAVNGVELKDLGK